MTATGQIVFSARLVWAVIILLTILGLYLYRDDIGNLEQHFGTKFNSFLQPYKVSRATIFKNYLILLLLYILQIALNQEIPLLNVPNWAFLVLVLVTWVFWFILSY